MTKRYRMLNYLSAFLLAATLTFFLAACQSEEPNEGATVEDITDAGVEETIEDVFGAQEMYEGYNSYVGQTVTVSGEIAGVYGPNAVLIGEDLWTENLLVVIPQGATITGTTAAGDAVSVFDDLDVDYVLQVTGQVQQYVEAEIETDYDWDLSTEVETEIEDQEPMIIADTVRVMTEEAAEEMD